MVWPPPSLLETSVEDFSRSFDSGVTGALSWTQLVRSKDSKGLKENVILLSMIIHHPINLT